MLKKLIAITALFVSCAMAHATASIGTVNFNNSATVLGGSGAPVFDVDGTTKIAGTGFFAQLYAAPGLNQSASSLVAVGTAVTFHGGVNAGFVQTSGNFAQGGGAVNPTVTVPTTTDGGAVTIQMRVWDSAYATFELAQAAHAKTGVSNVLSYSSVGNPNGNPPVTQTDLTGLQSFSLTIVPEPSTLALGALGGLALLFGRRRK